MSKNYKVVIPAIITVILLILVVAGYFYYQSHKNQSKSIPASPKVIRQQEVSDLVAEVGKLMVLPTGEVPTVATITDITKLKSQPFFIQAKNGDRVLIYSKAKKAILYDPDAHKVIDVAPINASTPSAAIATPGASLAR